MAGFLPNDLTGVGATPTLDDVFVIQEDGSSEVKKVTYSQILGGALTSGDIGNSVASLVGGTVPSSQLPSYVDDVIEGANSSSFPAGEAGKLYVALDTNKTYRWSGSAFVEIGSGLYATDIGSTVQAFSPFTVVDMFYNHTDENYTTAEKTKLGTALVGTDVGVSVQGYSVNTVIDASYVHTDLNFTTALKTNYDIAYTHSQSAHAPTDADNTSSNETSHANVVVDATYVATEESYTTVEKTKLGTALVGTDVGTSVQGYDANTVIDATYVATEESYTTVEKTKLGTALVGTDVGVSVQGYDVNTVVDASYVHTDANYTSDEQVKVGKIETVAVLTDGATVAVDMSTENQFSLATTQDFTLSNPTGLTAGQRGFLTITQDVTGSRILTLGSDYKTAGGTGITLSTTSDAVDVLRFEVINSTLILVELVADIK